MCVAWLLMPSECCHCYHVPCRPSLLLVSSISRCIVTVLRWQSCRLHQCLWIIAVAPCDIAALFWPSISSGLLRSIPGCSYLAGCYLSCHIENFPLLVSPGDSMFLHEWISVGSSPWHIAPTTLHCWSSTLCAFATSPIVSLLCSRKFISPRSVTFTCQ